MLTSQNFGSIVTGVAFHPTKNLVASCSSDARVKLWNADTGAELWTVSGHSQLVKAVSWSPDGTKLASGSLDNTVRIWDSASGEQLCSLNVGGSVSSIDFAPCGNKLAAAFNIHQGISFKEGGVKIFSNQGSAGFVCQSTLRGHRYAPSLSKECFLSFG